MDVQKYKILYKEGEAEISEKKSRFIAHIAPAQTEEEAQAFIEKIKKHTGMQGITGLGIQYRRKATSLAL